MATIFDDILGKAGELRYDSALDTTYRFNSRTGDWEVDGTGTPSSASFPTTGLTVGDVREDIDTGRSYRWSGSAWALVTVKASIVDADNDGIPDNIEHNSISTIKIVNSAVTADKLSSDSVSTNKIVDGAVTLAKTGITISDVTVLATESTVTATVPAGSVVLSVFPTSGQDTLIESVYITGTTLQIYLTQPSMGDISFKVVTIV